MNRGRRPGSRALRPVVLLAALLAPAVLALGLLVAELTEFGVPPYLRARPAQPPVFMAPTPLPRPATPDRLYEGPLPAPEKRHRPRKPPPIQAAAAPAPATPHQEPNTPPRTKATPPRPAPRQAPRQPCPDEWTDTWLWEMCQEEARKPA
ncbi:hypothetical protein Hesp01_66870 [Herbidospora sp. NBRC 101105]|nr:hypothetical protein Hesp01_66870 [Herbidospora sp. NBRC 101105]